MRLLFKDYLWISIQGLLFVLYLLPVELPYSSPDLLSWPAVLLMLIGLIEILWALQQLGTSLSPFPKPKSNAQLKTGGVFALVRHPIYGGLFLIAAGFGFYTENPYRLMMALVLLTFFYFKSAYEERNLRAFFRDYEAYAQRTGRFFPKLPVAKP